MKFLEAANNFTKFVGLVNIFWKVPKSRKDFMKFVDWKVRFRCLKVFLCSSFTRSNMLISKHKCFVNTFSCFMNAFHKQIKSWSLYEWARYLGLLKSGR